MKITFMNQFAICDCVAYKPMQIYIYISNYLQPINGPSAWS